MLNLCCDISIGKLRFRAVNDVLIKRSIFTVSATATIKLPLVGVIKQKDSAVIRVNITDVIAVGDKVKIALGYNDALRDEFTGYVSRINYCSPLEVECNNVYPLTNITVKKSFNKIALKDLLNSVSGGRFTLAPNTPQVTITNVVIDNQSILWVLDEIKGKYGLNIFFLPDGTLYAGLAYGYSSGKVKYNLRKNVINPDELKWSDAKDVKLKIKAICLSNQGGTKFEAELGDKDGEIRTLFFYDVKDKEHLKKLAESEMGKYRYSGFRGQLTTFLIPFSDIGMVANVEDPVYPVRTGDYYIESLEIRFGISGARRVINLGIKLNT